MEQASFLLLQQLELALRLQLRFLLARQQEGTAYKMRLQPPADPPAGYLTLLQLVLVAHLILMK